MKVIGKFHNLFIKHKVFLFCFILANTYFLLSSLPLFIQFQHAPKGSYYPLFHGASNYDFNVYLSAIRQGRDGNWLLKDAFTSEKTNPTIFYLYYILLGKITNPLNLSPEITYHLGRIISVEFFIISLYFLNLHIFGRKKTILSYFLTITGTIIPIFLFGEKDAFSVYFPWWGTLEALKRLDGLPHYLFGFGLLCWSNVLIFNYFKKPKFIVFLGIVLLIFFGGILFPPSLIPIVIALPVATLVNSLVSFRRNKSSFLTSFLQSRNLILFIFCSTALLSLLVIWRENANGFPWDFWNKWEIAKWNKNEPNFNRALFLTFGLLPIIALPSFIKSIMKGKLEDVYIALWAYLPFILLPFIDYLGISKFRLISIAPFIPLGILSAKTIFDIENRRTGWIVLLIFMLSTLPVTAQRLFIDISKARSAPLYSNVYISNNHWQAVDFLKKETPNNSIVLSNEYMGNIIPAYTHNISYFGHPVHTKDFYIKQHEISLFYGNNLSNEEAKTFVNKNNIGYIYFGPDEKSGTDKLKYSFLKEVFKNSDVSIFMTQ